MFRLISAGLLVVTVWITYTGTVLPWRANVLARRGRFEEALSMNTFVNYEVSKVMGERAVETDDRSVVERTERVLSEEAGSRPHDPKLWLLLGVVRARLGRWEGAHEAASEAVRLAPGRADAVELLRKTEEMIQ